MDAQLRLLTSPTDQGDDVDTPSPTGAWRLSEQTRHIGRRGVAEARAALAAARRPLPDARASAA